MKSVLILLPQTSQEDTPDSTTEIGSLTVDQKAIKTILEEDVDAYLMIDSKGTMCSPLKSSVEKKID